MTKLDDIVDPVIEVIKDWVESELSGTSFYKDSLESADEIAQETKQQIKDLMLELFEDNYKVLPIKPNGRPMFIANGILEDDYRQKVKEL